MKPKFSLLELDLVVMQTCARKLQKLEEEPKVLLQMEILKNLKLKL